MKKFGLKFAIILTILALTCMIAIWAVFSCSMTVVDAASEQNVLLAPISNLKDNEFAGVSTLKVMAIGESKYVYIPESYYLCDPVLFGNSGNMYQVTYCDTAFFYETEELVTDTVTFADGVDGNPDVRLTLNGDDVVVDIKGTTLTANHTIKLIGYNQDGSEVYVIATLDGVSVKGFVDVDSFAPFNVPYHPIAQAERDALLAELNKPTPDDGDITPNTSVALRVVLIIGIAVPAVIIAILLFKPTKNSRRQVKQENKDIDYDEPRDNARRR